MKDKICGALFITSVMVFVLFGLTVKATSAESFAGLGANAGDYEQVVRGKTFDFPKDHGPHLKFKIEWWYVTANVEDADGNQYGVQWTLFRHALKSGSQKKGWDNQQIWMAHAAVTTRDQHFVNELFSRGGIGQANVIASPFQAWIDDWALKSVQTTSHGQLNSLNLTANGKDFSYNLQLSSTAPLILQGEAGFSLKSDEGQASFYYSAPFLKVKGTLKLEGQDINITGRAWLDREWSSQPLNPDQIGWDWFSLHLNSGEKVMLFRLRYKDGRVFYSGNWIPITGQSEFLSNEDIEFTPMKNTNVQDIAVPTEWELSIKKKNFSITTVPLNPNSWMTIRFPYWEGPIHFTGTHPGVGYLEMTGY